MLLVANETVWENLLLFVCNILNLQQILQMAKASSKIVIAIPYEQGHLNEKKNPGVLPAHAVRYLQYHTPIANCCLADDNQNYMLLIWITSCVYSALSLRFLFSTGGNKTVEKSTSSLKWDGFLLTQVVPLCFCLHFLGCEKGLRRDEGSAVQIPGSGWPGPHRCSASSKCC